MSGFGLQRYPHRSPDTAAERGKYSQPLQAATSLTAYLEPHVVLGLGADSGMAVSHLTAAHQTVHRTLVGVSAGPHTAFVQQLQSGLRGGRYPGGEWGGRVRGYRGLGGQAGWVPVVLTADIFSQVTCKLHTRPGRKEGRHWESHALHCEHDRVSVTHALHCEHDRVSVTHALHCEHDTVPQTIRFKNSLLCLLSFYGNMMCAIGMYYIPK